ncbi:MAG TPA: hypothetical protein QGF05_14905 [Dehalococcoidia bacterium]|nr:hypothetical protein [Dehalococcoidia bacterium]
MFILLVAAVGAVAATYGESITRSDQARVEYEVGANLRVSGIGQHVAGSAADALAPLKEREDVAASAATFRSFVTIGGLETAARGTLLGVQGERLGDGEEVLGLLPGGYTSDPLNADTDGDDLSDGDEVRIHGTDPSDWDTDSDGLLDNFELLDLGSDPLDPDTDGDGFRDGDEVAAGTDPLDPNDPSDPIEVVPDAEDSDVALVTGWNSIVFLGADGANPATLAADLPTLGSIWAFDPATQAWLVYRGGPLGALTSTLTSLSHGMVLFLQMEPGDPVVLR